jgi:hypothetical protein
MSENSEAAESNPDKLLHHAAERVGGALGARSRRARYVCRCRKLAQDGPNAPSAFARCSCSFFLLADKLLPILPPLRVFSGCTGIPPSISSACCSCFHLEITDRFLSHGTLSSCPFFFPSPFFFLPCARTAPAFEYEIVMPVVTVVFSVLIILLWLCRVYRWRNARAVYVPIVVTRPPPAGSAVVSVPAGATYYGTTYQAPPQHLPYPQQQQQQAPPSYYQATATAPAPYPSQPAGPYASAPPASAPPPPYGAT